MSRNNPVSRCEKKTYVVNKSARMGAFIYFEEFFSLIYRIFKTDLA